MGWFISIDGPATAPLLLDRGYLVRSKPAVAMAEEVNLSPDLLTEEMKHNNGALVLPDGLCWVSVLSCLLLACSYVGSLYVWKSDLPR